MDDTLPSGEPVAEGEQFWKWVWESQTKCEALTDQMLPKEEIFGKRARETFTKLGTVASMLDRVASCWWFYSTPLSRRKRATREIVTH
jgi:hypothetical protein